MKSSLFSASIFNYNNYVHSISQNYIYLIFICLYLFITTPQFWGLIVCYVWSEFCGIRRLCNTSCFVGKIREQSWWSWSRWVGRQTTETLKREKGRPACLKWERLIVWTGALKVGALRWVMCPPVRKKMLISGLPAWLLVGGCQEHRVCASLDRGWWGGGLISSHPHLWLNYYEALRLACILECRQITATK